MSLVALILATEISQGEPGILRAALPLAGRTLLERQAEQARAVGANHILVMVATLPQDLTSAMDRIRTSGCPVTPLRSISEIPAHVGAQDQLMLVADGLVAPEACYEALADANAPALLATPDNQAARDLERIDGQTRWAGLALLPHSMVAQLGAVPDDWDIGSTLLRQAVQAGGHRIMCEAALFERGEVTIITNTAEASLITTSMLQQADFGGEGMGQRALFAPFARLVGPALLRQHVPTAALYGGALGLLAAGLTAAFFGQPLWAAVAGLLASAGYALGGFQQLFTENRRMIARLKQAATLAAYAFPLALIAPTVLRAPTKAENLYLAALALIVMLLWAVRKPLIESKSANSRSIALADPEIFFLILLVTAMIGFPMMALPVAGTLAAAGILLWLMQTSEK